jgi:hypothetical protein
MERSTRPLKRSVEQEVKLENVKPEEFGRFFFTLFGKIDGNQFTPPKWGNRLPQTTSNLIEKCILVSLAETEFAAGYKDKHVWRYGLGLAPSTEHLTPDSPQIKPENVDKSKYVVTLTIEHYMLGWGPKTELVITLNENGEIKVYQKPKGQGVEGLFMPVESLEQVKELITHGGDDRPRITLLETYYPYNNTYKCLAAFKVSQHAQRRPSMLDLFSLAK